MLEEHESTRNCNAKRRDKILSEKNEQNVDRGGGNGAGQWRGKCTMKKRGVEGWKGWNK